jgi:hypothetical protein
MKPKEQKSQALRQAKGLARWGWIKRYLKPAMDYVGITSEQFDEVFIGNDQFIRERTLADPFSRPTISINGTIYEPLNSDGTVYDPENPKPVVPKGNTADGYLYSEFIAAVGNAEFEPDSITGIIYRWDRTFEFHPTLGLPKYKFYTLQQNDGSLFYINTTGLGLGPYAEIKILVASRKDGVVQLYGVTNNTVNVALRGFENIRVITGLLT